MNEVVVSIIAPVFNSSLFLKELLDGVISQQFQDWEFILIDDGSTDTSRNIVNEYSLRDTRIKLLVRSREPKSAQTCRNIGIENSKGKYLIVIDSDDCVGDLFLEQRVDFMEKHPDIDYATFHGMSFRAEKNKKVFEKKWGRRVNKDLLMLFLSANYPFGVWNNIYRREVFDSVAFDENIYIYQDFDLIVNVIIKGFKHDFCDTSSDDYFYRKGQEGAMTSSFVNGKKYESTIYLLTKISRLLMTTHKSRMYRKAFLYFYLLQFQRVLLYGDYIQSKRFYDLVKSEYADFKWISKKMKFLNSVVESKKTKKLSQKKITFTFNILFYKRKLFRFLRH